MRAAEVGDFAAARVGIEEALRLRHGHPRHQAESYQALGAIAAAAGDLPLARLEYGRAQELLRSLGDDDDDDAVRQRLDEVGDV